VARSGCAIAHQLQYVEARIVDLKELKERTFLSPNGLEYRCQLRMFSGDGPARSLEAGHSCGGEFNY